MKKYVMGDFMPKGESLYDLRVAQMQPAMVEFCTQDHLERQLIAEMRNLNYGDENFYYVGDEDTPEVSNETSSVNIVKPSIEQVAAEAVLNQKPVRVIGAENQSIDLSSVSETETINMVKPTLGEAVQAVQAQQAPQTNKPLLYGGIAAIAALLYFSEG